MFQWQENDVVMDFHQKADLNRVQVGGMPKYLQEKWKYTKEVYNPIWKYDRQFNVKMKKKKKRQTMIHKTLHRKLKIEQQESK